MTDTNQITVRGRVGTEPDVFVTGTGKEVTRFRLGSTRSFRDSATGEWRDAETAWFTVKAWGPAAQAVQESIHRGMPVIVQGIFSFEEWVSGDQQRNANVITAHAIGVDIRHGRVRHFRVSREAPADGERTEQGVGAAVDDGDGGQSAADELVDAGLADAGADGGGSDLTDGEPTLAPDAVDPSMWEKAPVDA